MTNDMTNHNIIVILLVISDIYVIYMYIYIFVCFGQLSTFELTATGPITV